MEVQSPEQEDPWGPVWGPQPLAAAEAGSLEPPGGLGGRPGGLVGPPGGWGALIAMRKGRATSARACLPGQHRLRLGIRAEISLEPLVLDQFVEGHIVPPALGITGERFVHDAALQRTVH